MAKVGIPRALLYYQYFPMWKAFFEELGAEVVLSEPTNRGMVAAGSSRVVSDTCLPVKIFLGHVISLSDKCDFIFIPSVRSVRRKTYNCSKFLGLPDMARAVVPEAPRILDLEIDVNRGPRYLYQEVYRTGRPFTWRPERVRRAAWAAWRAHLEYRSLMAEKQLAPPRALARFLGEPEEEPEEAAGSEGTIALIGHPYLLYDEHINHRFIHRLGLLNQRVITPEMVAPEELDTAMVNLTGGAYWAYEEDVVGAGGHYLQNGASGIIGIMTFGCGPDSQMMDMVHRQAARLKTTPFMCLTLDEHTAETGVITRLEAFLDMIHRRRRKDACG